MSETPDSLRASAKIAAAKAREILKRAEEWAATSERLLLRAKALEDTRCEKCGRTA